MAESVAESGSFTQDLFSPLQICEVVEEGQQQRQQQQLTQQQQSHQQQQQQQHMQQLYQHQAHLNQQQMATLQTHQQTHHHHQQQPNNQQAQIQTQTQQIQQPQPTPPQQTQQQQPQPQPQQPQQQSVKQETTQQTIQPQLLNGPDAKTQTLMNGVSSMEIFLATPNPIHLQAVSPPLVAIHQQHLSQPMYHVQLTRQQQQTLELTRHTHQALQHLQLGTIHLQGQPQTQNVQLQQNHQRIQDAQPPATPMSVGTIVNVGATSESFALPVTTATATNTKPPTTNAVATQTTPTDNAHYEDDEPEIIFTSVPNATQDNTSTTLSVHSSNDSNAPRTPKMQNGTLNHNSEGNAEVIHLLYVV